MKKVFLPLFAGCAFMAPMGIHGQQVEAPTHQIGDYWYFEVSREQGREWNSRIQSGRYGVVMAGDKLRFFQFDNAQKTEVNDKPHLARMVTFVDETGVSYVKFPLDVGVKWDGTYRMMMNTSRPGKANWRHQTLQKGTVQTNVLTFTYHTTPAGSFEVFTIRRRDQIVGGGFNSTYYYSGICKCIVDFVARSSMTGMTKVELIEYGRNPTLLSELK